MAVVARKDLPANNIDEFVAPVGKAAAEGRPLTCGSVGVGSLYLVPCKGGAPLGQALVGGVLDVSLISVGAQQVAPADQGRIKMLGTPAPSVRRRRLGSGSRDPARAEGSVLSR